MEEEVEVKKLIDRIRELKPRTKDSKRVLVGIAGIPGSGKTTLAQKICSLIPEISINVPMDGFHYPRSYLDSQPNSAELHRRRGAHWTFDVDALRNCLERLRSDRVVTCPSFDHCRKDPIDNDIRVDDHVQIVIMEGNYLLFDDDVIGDDNKGKWRSISEIFNYTIFVECPLEVARSRLIDRHLQSGICSSRKEAELRTDENDLENAQLILRHRLASSQTIFN